MRGGLWRAKVPEHCQPLNWLKHLLTGFVFTYYPHTGFKTELTGEEVQSHQMSSYTVLPDGGTGVKSLQHSMRRTCSWIIPGNKVVSMNVKIDWSSEYWFRDETWHSFQETKAHFSTSLGGGGKYCRGRCHGGADCCATKTFLGSLKISITCVPEDLLDGGFVAKKENEKVKEVELAVWLKHLFSLQPQAGGTIFTSKLLNTHKVLKAVEDATGASERGTVVV